jgi:hypothetical protein
MSTEPAADEPAEALPAAGAAVALRINFHEGSVMLPPGFEDRTTNLFVPTNPQAQPNLSVARDWMKSGETLQTYVDRQLALLKSQLASHRLLARDAAQLGHGEKALTGQRIDANYKNGKHLVHQRQAAFELKELRVIVFTASSPIGFNAAFEQLWVMWLGSYVPPALAAAAAADDLKAADV